MILRIEKHMCGLHKSININIISKSNSTYEKWSWYINTDVNISYIHSIHLLILIAYIAVTFIKIVPPILKNHLFVYIFFTNRNCSSVLKHISIVIPNNFECWYFLLNGTSVSAFMHLLWSLNYLLHSHVDFSTMLTKQILKQMLNKKEFSVSTFIFYFMSIIFLITR